MRVRSDDTRKAVSFSQAALDAVDTRLWLELARRGAMAEAWELSDRLRARTRVFGDPSMPRHQQSLWDGTPVDGRRVLVRCYHGLGDTIQFARFLPFVAARAASVAVWVQPVLLPTLRSLPGHYDWLPLHDGAPDVPADVDLEIMEIAQLFRPSLETLPTAPYLRVDGLTQPASRQLRVGVTWRAGDWEAARSLPFAAISPWFDDERIDWWSLQYPQQACESHPRLRQLRTPAILSLARLASSLDLVVTIDSMPAHLSGALGLPTWTLLRRHADWRWLEGRTDTPWYPSMRLFRQAHEGDWSVPIAEASRELDSAISRRSVAQLRAR